MDYRKGQVRELNNISHENHRFGFYIVCKRTDGYWDVVYHDSDEFHKDDFDSQWSYVEPVKSTIFCLEHHGT